MKNVLKVLPGFILGIMIVFASGYLSSCRKNDGDKTIKIKCVTCMNGGQCINDSCRCPAGYEGLYCETTSVNKFLGSWDVSEKGSISVAKNYTAYIQSDTVNGSVRIEFFNNYFSSYVKANTVKDSIFIPEQVLQGKRVIGKGITYHDPNMSYYNRLYLAYKVTDLVTSIVDDYGYDSPSTSNVSVWTR